MPEFKAIRYSGHISEEIHRKQHKKIGGKKVVILSGLFYLFFCFLIKPVMYRQTFKCCSFNLLHCESQSRQQYHRVPFQCYLKIVIFQILFISVREQSFWFMETHRSTEQCSAFWEPSSVKAFALYSEKWMVFQC